MKQAWLVRPYPDGKTKRIDEFKRGNFVAIGWPCIGNLAGKSREELKELLSGEPYNYSGLSLGNAYATIDILVNRMEKGDYLLIPDGDDIYFAIVDSDYVFDASVDNMDTGYPHQRKVKRFSASHLRNELSKSLRSSLKVHRTTADLSKHYDEIRALTEGESFSSEVNSISVSYALRPNYTVSLTVPHDITRTEAKRLSMYLESLFFKEDTHISNADTQKNAVVDTKDIVAEEHLEAKLEELINDERIVDFVADKFFTPKQWDALTETIPMTQDLFDRCLYVCDRVKDGISFHRITKQFPAFKVNYDEDLQAQYKQDYELFKAEYLKKWGANALYFLDE